jgi:hypothetical protein
MKMYMTEEIAVLRPGMRKRYFHKAMFRNRQAHPEGSLSAALRGGAYGSSADPEGACLDVGKYGQCRQEERP